jgi:hypothetical protein
MKNFNDCDFQVKETKGGYYLLPVSKTAKELCRRYKGVIMKQFFVLRSELDSLLDYFSSQTTTGITTIYEF